MWLINNNDKTVEIANILEYISFAANLNDEKYKILMSIEESVAEYIYRKPCKNNDDLARSLLIDQLVDEELCEYFCFFQNIDGGFGLDKGYTSDIIDTKLALKTLADLGETEAKIKYILPTRKRTL